jgi:hypothetical protein
MLTAMRRGAKRSCNGAMRWAAPWVLAMLCLRALVPAGFMLEPIDGRLAVVLCDTDAAGAVHHQGGQDHPSHHHHLQLDPTCPYAQSAGPAPLPALPVLGPQPVVSAPLQLTHVAQTYARSGPSRQNFPRGPPHLA